MDSRPDPGLARLQRYALAVWCWRARSRIACSPTKYAKPQWASRCRSDSGRAERRMSGDRAGKLPGCVRLCEYPGLSFQRSPVCACSLVSSLLLSGATMSQQPSLTQSAHSVRQVLTAYSPFCGGQLISFSCPYVKLGIDDSNGLTDKQIRKW